MVTITARRLKVFNCPTGAAMSYRLKKAIAGGSALFSKFVEGLSFPPPMSLEGKLWREFRLYKLYPRPREADREFRCELSERHTVGVFLSAVSEKKQETASKRAIGRVF